MKNYLFILLLVSIFLTLESKAHVSLNYPEGGETFFSGDNVVIEWTELVHHDTQHWELYFSSDSGETWITISDSIAYPFREYTWAVPLDETGRGMIKVIQNNPGNNYEDESADFTIENTTVIGQGQSTNQLFQSFNIFPNPIQSIGNLNFTLDNSEFISFEFYNINGTIVDYIPGRNFLPGSHTIQWNRESLKPGTYVCIVRTKDFGKAFKLRIIQ